MLVASLWHNSIWYAKILYHYQFKNKVLLAGQCFWVYIKNYDITFNTIRYLGNYKIYNGNYSNSCYSAAPVKYVVHIRIGKQLFIRN